jgi:signal peptidase I
MESDAQAQGRIARSWRLTRAAWQLVRADRALLILALFSGLLGLVGIGLIFGLSELLRGAHVGKAGGPALAAVALAYPLTFISVFLNTAIAAAAIALLDGRRLSLREALAVPARRIGRVALWALLAAGVGLLLEQVASRLPLLGSVATRLVGLAWSLASLFAIPILAAEGCSAPQCLRRSAELVKSRWGEGISGNVIITAWVLLVAIPLGVLVGIGVGATRHQAQARDTVIALAGVLLLSLVAVAAVVRQTFAVALYRYATTGAAQGPFEVEDLQSPFRAKNTWLGHGGVAPTDGGAPARRGRTWPSWLTAIALLILILVFVLSFGQPILILVLLGPALLGFYERVRSRSRSQLSTAVFGVAVVLLCARILLPGFALRTIAIRSAAMEPTIGVHDRVLFNRTGIGGIGIGDIVAFHPPVDAHRRLCGPVAHAIKPGGAACSTPEREHTRGYYIRRIVARPGDVISIVEGTVIRNGVREHSSYVRACGSRPQCNFPIPIKVPAGMWFVLGDNRRESDDSRYFGPVPKNWITGVAIMRTWPPRSVGFL